MARNSILSSHRQVLRQIIGSNSRTFQTLISSPPTPIPTSSLFSPVPPKPFPSGSSRVHFSDLPFFPSRPLPPPSGPSNIVLINSENDFNSSLSKAQDDSVPAIFYFTEAGFGPCLYFGPIIGHMSEKYPHVTTYKIDIDQEGLQSILSKLNITSVPTVHFFQNGKKAAEVIGADIACLTNTMEKLYNMGKISKKNGGDPSKEVQWSSVMDDALVDAFLYQVIIGGRVNGTFTSKAYDDIVKVLVEKFDMEINKDMVKNRQKTLKKNFYECYDIFKDGLSGFGWNDSLNMWTAEPEVWEPLIASKPAAKKWMTTPIPNYFKMAQLWAKNRAKGHHAETAKEKHARYAASTTIDEIDNLISQNEVSLENFEVEDDQRSPEINVARSRVSSLDAMSSKNKKKRLAEDDELRNVISQSFDNVSKAIDRATKVMAKCFSKSYGAEVHAALGVLDLDPISKTEAYIFLMENPTYKEMFFGCPDHERKCVLLTLMSRPKN